VGRSPLAFHDSFSFPPLTVLRFSFIRDVGFFPDSLFWRKSFREKCFPGTARKYFSFPNSSSGSFSRAFFCSEVCRRCGLPPLVSSFPLFFQPEMRKFTFSLFPRPEITLLYPSYPNQMVIDTFVLCMFCPLSPFFLNEEGILFSPFVATTADPPSSRPPVETPMRRLFFLRRWPHTICFSFL